MRYLLINEEEIAGQTDTVYKPRTPDGRIILTEGEAKALDNFSAQFVTADSLRVIMATPINPPLTPIEPQTPVEEPEDIDPGFSVTPPEDDGIEDVEPVEEPENPVEETPEDVEEPSEPGQETPNVEPSNQEEEHAS